MKNYYEILEVDVKASKEIIEKAFKVLAKRYHPDTQSEDKKKWAEEKFKEINEAYEILSDEDARKKYDAELDYDKNGVLEALCAKNEHLQHLVHELEQELEYVKKHSNYYNSHNTNQNYSGVHYVNMDQAQYEDNIKSQYNAVHNNQYQRSQEPYTNSHRTAPQNETVYYETNIPYTQNRFKDFLAFLITVFAIIGLGFLLWKIPFTNKFLVRLYVNNPPIKAVVDLILGLFSK